MDLFQNKDFQEGQEIPLICPEGNISLREGNIKSASAVEPVYQLANNIGAMAHTAPSVLKNDEVGMGYKNLYPILQNNMNALDSILQPDPKKVEKHRPTSADKQVLTKLSLQDQILGMLEIEEAELDGVETRNRPYSFSTIFPNASGMLDSQMAMSGDVGHLSILSPPLGYSPSDYSSGDDDDDDDEIEKEAQRGPEKTLMLPPAPRRSSQEKKIRKHKKRHSSREENSIPQEMDEFLSYSPMISESDAEYENNGLDMFDQDSLSDKSSNPSEQTEDEQLEPGDILDEDEIASGLVSEQIALCDDEGEFDSETATLRPNENGPYRYTLTGKSQNALEDPQAIDMVLKPSMSQHKVPDLVLPLVRNAEILKQPIGATGTTAEELFTNPGEDNPGQIGSLQPRERQPPNTKKRLSSRLKEKIRIITGFHRRKSRGLHDSR